MIKRVAYITLTFLLAFSSSIVRAALTIEITQGSEGAIPVAIVPFLGESAGSQRISHIVSQDLKNSGQFSVLPVKKHPERPHTASDATFTKWQRQHVDAIVIGEVKALAGNQLKVTFQLLDVYSDKVGYQAGSNIKGGKLVMTTNRVIVGKTFTIPVEQHRKLAHKISDIIYEKLVGQKGVFSTKIVYVSVQNQGPRQRLYQLEIADIDGLNSQTLLSSKEPILSPDWSPDGQQLAYVSFENRRPEVFIQDVRTGKRKKVAGFSGVNGAPAWSPDGSKLALSLSKDGNSEIYIVSLNNMWFQRITNNSAIDTEPNWSPDGRKIIFTSDRGGNPQIYEYDFYSKRVVRLTYEGTYNARARYTPDGTQIIMVHRQEQEFRIALQDTRTKSLLILTTTASDESPTIAPNGHMILYATQYKGYGVLSATSIDGSVRLNLPSVSGIVKEPSWSPFITG